MLTIKALRFDRLEALREARPFCEIAFSMNTASYKSRDKADACVLKWPAYS